MDFHCHFILPPPPHPPLNKQYYQDTVSCVGIVVCLLLTLLIVVFQDYNEHFRDLNVSVKQWVFSSNFPRSTIKTIVFYNFFKIKNMKRIRFAIIVALEQRIFNFMVEVNSR